MNNAARLRVGLNKRHSHKAVQASAGVDKGVEDKG